MCESIKLHFPQLFIILNYSYSVYIHASLLLNLYTTME